MSTRKRRAGGLPSLRRMSKDVRGVRWLAPIKSKPYTRGTKKATPNLRPRCVFRQAQLLLLRRVLFSHRPSNIVSVTSPVATNIPQAAGIALAAKLRREDTVVVTCFGEGSTSEGDFHEGLNWAGIHKLPVIFFCQNNQYAISVPVPRQRPHRPDRHSLLRCPATSFPSPRCARLSLSTCCTACTPRPRPPR